MYEMKKYIYIGLLIIGGILTTVNIVLWAKAGFPFYFSELPVTLFANKPWHIEKDSYLFFVVLGLFISIYAIIELSLKRWEKINNENI